MTTPDDDGSETTRPRISRPEPQRTMPRRGWSNLFGPIGEPGAPAGTGATGRAAAEPGEDRASDTVSRAVELGYRVIDDYVRQGQKAAQRLSSRSWSPETALRDTQDFTARLTHHASDMVALWLDLLDSANLTGSWRTAASSWPGAAGMPFGDAASPNDAPPQAAPPTTASAPQPAGGPAGRTRIAVELASERPAEVTVDLRSEDTVRPLVVHSLRAVEPEKPRITAVSIEPATAHAPARLRIRIPSDQPPGTYNALVIDEETSRPAGSISVRIAG